MEQFNRGDKYQFPKGGAFREVAARFATAYKQAFVKSMANRKHWLRRKKSKYPRDFATSLQLEAASSHPPGTRTLRRILSRTSNARAREPGAIGNHA